MKRLFNYLRPSFEGEDGKFSYRRASQFIFIAISLILVLTKMVITQYGFYALVATYTVFLLLAAVISAQQILEGLQSLNPFKKCKTPDPE
jgi:hypothetical protein